MRKEKERHQSLIFLISAIYETLSPNIRPSPHLVYYHAKGFAREQCYGINNNNNVELDILSTGWVDNIN